MAFPEGGVGRNEGGGGVLLAGEGDRVLLGVGLEGGLVLGLLGGLGDVLEDVWQVNLAELVGSTKQVDCQPQV